MDLKICETMHKLGPDWYNTQYAGTMVRVLLEGPDSAQWSKRKKTGLGFGFNWIDSTILKQAYISQSQFNWSLLQLETTGVLIIINFYLALKGINPP